MIDLAHLGRVQCVLDALANIDGDRGPAIAAIACEDAAVAFMIGLSVGITARQVADRAREVLQEETARQIQ